MGGKNKPHDEKYGPYKWTSHECNIQIREAERGAEFN